MSAEKALFNAVKNKAHEAVLHILNSRQLTCLDGLDKTGKTPLMLALEQKAHLTMQILLDAGANVDAKDLAANTALHWAVSFADETAVKLLLRYHARTDVLNRDQKTPLMLLKGHRSRSIEALLKGTVLSNYHADQLALREDIIALTDEEDVLSALVQEGLALLPTLEAGPYQQALNSLIAWLLPPEELLLWSKDLTQSGDTKKSHSSLPFLPSKKRLAALDASPKSFSTLSEFSKEQIAQATLVSDNRLFTSLNQAIEVITQFQGKHLKGVGSSYTATLSTALEKVKTLYLNYRDAICYHHGEVRLALLSGRVRVRGFLGFRYLNAGASLRFSPFFAASNALPLADGLPRRDTEYGMHAVLQLRDTFYKVRPTAPGIENAFDSFNKLLTGQGSTPTELLIFEKGEKAFPVLASKAVEGINFADVLEKHPDWVDSIDPFNYSAHVILTILTRPSDAKPDNFVALVDHEDGQRRLKLIGIDNDLAFEDPVLMHYSRQSPAGEHFLNLKSLFFCLPQINESIDPIFRQAFLAQSPLLLMLKWLKSLHIQEAHYLSYRQAGKFHGDPASGLHRTQHTRALFTAEEFKQMQLPVKFLPGTIADIYHDLQKIHSALHNNPRITHAELLQTLYPFLGVCYQHIRDTETDIYKRVSYAYSIHSVESLCQQQPSALQSLASYTRDLAVMAKARTESVEKVCEDFINTLDYQTLPDPYLQGYVLGTITTDFQFLKQLRIANCVALTDKRLEDLAYNLKHLQSLTLTNCENLDGAGLSTMLCHHPHIHLTLERFSSISALNLFYLINHCVSLTLVVKKQLYSVKSQANELLKLLLSRKEDTRLLTALLMAGTHLNSAGGQSSALHVATEAGRLPVVHELIHYGAPLHILNEQGESVLDVALAATKTVLKVSDKSKYQAILLALVEAGALVCKNADGILQTLQTVISNSNQKQLFEFMRYHRKLSPGWVSQLMPTDLTSLDLGQFQDFELHDLPLTSELIKAIGQQAPQITHFNLTACSGLSRALLKDLLTWPVLQSIDMTFEQAKICGLVSLDNLQEAAEIKLQDQNKIISVRITQLRWMGQQVSQDILLKLGAFIRKSCHLKSLTLCNCQLDAIAIKTLAGSLVANTSLERLELDRNPNLQDEGVLVLANNLLKHPALQELSLEKTEAGLESAEAIGKLLQHLPRLKCLDLQGNPLGDKGASKLAEGLQARQRALQDKCPQAPGHTLEHLGLNQTGIGEAGALDLARALLFCKTLTYVDIAYNRTIGSSGTQGFIELLQLNPQLTTFKADEIGADEQLAQQLKLSVLRNQRCQQRSTLTHRRGNNLPLWKQRIQTLLPPEYLALKDLQGHTESLRKTKRITPLGESLKLQVSSISTSTTSISTTTPNTPPQTGDFLQKSKPSSAVWITTLKNQLNALRAQGYAFSLESPADDVSTLLIKVLPPATEVPGVVEALWRAMRDLLGKWGQGQVVAFNYELLVLSLKPEKCEDLVKRFNEVGITRTVSVTSGLIPTSSIV